MKAVPSPRKDKKTGTITGIRWSFWEYAPDKKRYDRVRVAQIPQRIRDSQNQKEVEDYCKSQSAKNDTIRHRAEQLRKWKEQYHDFEEYLEKFSHYQKEGAPNSWENDVFYLESYVFGFFLSKSSINNLNEWPSMFDDFRAWLKVIKPLKQKKDRIKLNTQVKIIKSLNCFLSFCFSKNWILQLAKCPNYKREDTLVVNADDLFTDEEKPRLHEALKQIRPISADFFTVLINCTLRENEGLGLSCHNVIEGHIDGKKSEKIHQSLQNYGLGSYHGYLCVDSQPALPSIRNKKMFTDRFGKSWDVGSVPRKPLKHRRQIAPKNCRYNPIFNAEAWNILVERTNAASELLKTGVYGDNPENYLLFDGLTANMFYGDLTEACAALKIKHRSPHKTRHTFLTWFYGTVGEDMFLADKVAGHKDRRDIERYSHISEQIGREQKLKQQNSKKLRKVSI